MIQGRYYIDSHGYPRAELLNPNEALGTFLEQDIQGSKSTCEELLQNCEEVLTGIRNNWSWEGNAHTLSVSKAHVIIQNMYAADEAVCMLAISDLKTAILNWMQLLQGPS